MSSFVPFRYVWRYLGQPTACLCLLGALSLPGVAFAQHHGGGMPGGHGGFGAGAFRGARGTPPDVHEDERGSVGPRSNGLELGPPARWWDDKHFAKRLHLRSDQQRRMDAIFEQNRTILLKRFEALEKEEQRMQTLTHASTLDENALFAEIDRVEQARADLEKANTHYLVQLRSQMNPGQLAHLAEQH